MTLTSSPPGHGSLEVVRRGDRSVVTRARATSPLRLLTPRNHGHGAWVYSATYGGGLVGGDALRLDVSVGAGAAALLSTQASTKIYRSPRGTSSELNAVVSSGALLAVLPDPVVCFASATYRQTQRVEMDRGAGLVLIDWLSAGRHACGERWRFDSYTSRLEVYQEGRLMVLDALTLDAGPPAIGARLGRFNVLCVILLIGLPVQAHAASVVARASSLPIEKQTGLLLGASSLGEPADGCILRMAGVSLQAVAAAARDYLRFVPSLLGDDPWARQPSLSMAGEGCPP